MKDRRDIFINTTVTTRRIQTSSGSSGGSSGGGGGNSGSSGGAFLKYYCLAHIINIRTTAYMRKAGVHTSTMPEAPIGYF